MCVGIAFYDEKTVFQVSLHFIDEFWMSFRCCYEIADVCSCDGQKYSFVAGNGVWLGPLFNLLASTPDDHKVKDG